MVKVFLSSSGKRSREIALLLHDWLPSVYHQVEPFTSAVDIDAGARWQQVVADELASTSFGILCVTAANRFAPWLCFEAGALSHSIDAARVVPLAIDLEISEISLPLAQFQAHKLTKPGMTEVVSAIDEAAERPMGKHFTEQAVAKWWPDLERRADAVLMDEQTRTERMNEIANAVRAASGSGEGIRYASTALANLRRRAPILNRRTGGESRSYGAGPLDADPSALLD
jgi:hypothetical protein